MQWGGLIRSTGFCRSGLFVCSAYNAFGHRGAHPAWSLYAWFTIPAVTSSWASFALSPRCELFCPGAASMPAISANPRSTLPARPEYGQHSDTRWSERAGRAELNSANMQITGSAARLDPSWPNPSSARPRPNRLFDRLTPSFLFADQLLIFCYCGHYLFTT